MLLANIATAHHIYGKFPELALLRCHPPPKTKMVDELQELCDQLGINIDLSSAGALHVSSPISDISETILKICLSSSTQGQIYIVVFSLQVFIASILYPNVYKLF